MMTPEIAAIRPTPAGPRLQRDQEGEPSVDELADQQQAQHEWEMRQAEEVPKGEARRPLSYLPARPGLLFEEDDQPDERQGAQARRHEEGKADPEVRRHVAAGDRPDGHAQKLGRLDPPNRHRHLVARTRHARDGHRHHREAREDALEQTRDEQLVDRRHDPHGGDDDDEAGQRPYQHELATDAIREPAPKGSEQARYAGRDGQQHAGPNGDLSRVGDPSSWT